VRGKERKEYKGQRKNTGKGKLKERIKEVRERKNKEHKWQIERKKEGKKTEKGKYRCPCV
jgi:hypothetical protein